MRTRKIKNGFGFCAKKGCKHLMSTTFELVEKDQEGKLKRKRKFSLCEDCTFELLQELDNNIEIR